MHLPAPSALLLLLHIIIIFILPLPFLIPAQVYKFVRHLLEQEGVVVPDTAAAAAAAVTEVGKKGRRARGGSKKVSNRRIKSELGIVLGTESLELTPSRRRACLSELP